MTPDEMRTWLRGHDTCVALGINVGQLNIDKARRIRLALTRTEGQK